MSSLLRTKSAGSKKETQAQKEAAGTGDLGFTGYEGVDYETTKYDIDDRLDDIKFLHSPFVERSPAGGPTTRTRSSR